MTPPSATYVSEPRSDAYRFPGGPSSGAVSWIAIFAGAAAAAALSLILLMLGAGLGLSSLSPWAQEGASAKTLGIGTVLWVIFMQLAASALGGYMAGRLRTKWVDLARDEIVFRDSAHGFLTWAVATLLTAALLTSAVSSIVRGSVQAGAEVAGGAASTAASAAAGTAASAGENGAKSGGGPMGYLVDSLFRGPKASNGASSPEQATTEVTRIFTNAIATGKLPEEDGRYAAQLVARRSGVSQAEAEKRVNATFNQVQMKMKEAETKAREAADAARKASAVAALLLFVSLLIGAFVAGYSAIVGGRHRDD